MISHNNYHQRMQEKKAEADKLKKELDDKTSKINALRKSQVDIKNKMEDYQRSLVDNQRKASHWKEQRSRLSLHNYRYNMMMTCYLLAYNTCFLGWMLVNLI